MCVEEKDKDTELLMFKKKKRKKKINSCSLPVKVEHVANKMQCHDNQLCSGYYVFLCLTEAG